MDDYIWFGYLYAKPDSSLILSRKLYSFSEASNNKRVMGNALNMMGIAHTIKGNTPRALYNFKRSLKIRESLKDKKGIATTLNNIGLSYNYQGNNPKALEHYQRSLISYENIDDRKGIAMSLNNIGIIYHQQENYPAALDYYDRSLKVKEEIGDSKGIAVALSNMGSVYTNYNQFPKALDYHERSLKIREQIKDINGIASSLMNIGAIYKQQEDYAKAIEYLGRSLAIDEEIGNKRGVVQSLVNLGSIYNVLGIYNKAMNACQRSLDLSEEIGIIKLQKDACNCLYKIYKSIGNGTKALQYHEQMLVLNDSLQTEETAKKLQQMEFAKQVLADSLLQVEKDLQVEMAHQTEVRQKDKSKNLAIGAGIFFLLLSGGLYSRWRYVKKSKAVIEKERDRSENLLLNILPSEIADELKAKGSAEARDFELVSILFTDFKGFTRASEKLTAQELIEEINVCFKAFDHICEKHGIEKIKTIGDAYMAAGGLPVPSENATKNTVVAALAMQAFISNRIIEKQKTKETSFTMRVGIHTGPVVAGIVGVKKFQYDIWGDTVNTAARMESSGEIGRVNISEDTYTLLQNDPDFTFVSRGKIQAKGKGEIDMYFVSLKNA